MLDRGRIAHIAFTDGGQPYCIPTLYARVGDRVLIHSSAASRMLRVLGGGAPACLTVTVLDGLVLARSAFEHSANYDAVVLLGSFQKLDNEQKLQALHAFMERQLPGRWSEVRAPNRKELKATVILALPIREASVKTRTGPPDDDKSSDAELGVWAGVIPLQTTHGEPQPSPGLRPEINTSPSINRLIAQSRAGSAASTQ